MNVLIFTIKFKLLEGAMPGNTVFVHFFAYSSLSKNPILLAEFKYLIRTR